MRTRSLKIQFAKPLCQLLFFSILASGLAVVTPGKSHALGAPAGATITNLATLSYHMGGPALQQSATANFQIDELIDLDLASLDLAPVSVLPGESDVPIAFRLTNTGNGTETFELTIDNLLVGNDFNPLPGTPVEIYLDDGDENFDDALDTAYTLGVNDPALVADANQVIFVLNDIPAAINAGVTGSSQLTAKSTTGSGAAWTVLAANTGDGNTTAILGNSGGLAQDSGSYQATGLHLDLNKSYTIIDPDGTNDPVPGAVITYRIQANVIGVGTLSNIFVTDLVPANTTYVAESMKLNSNTLTDAPADDAGDFDITDANTITVSLGDMSAASPSQTIEFQVSID